MILIVCGVSGCGKTTTGKLLSQRLGLKFYDADDFHSKSNVEKMSNGLPLTDEDRKPWLETLATNLSQWQSEGGAVLACSALKESYRKPLNDSCEDVRWITLRVPEGLLAERVSTREHFFDQRLLQSQLEIFEIPYYGCVVNAFGTPDEIVDNIILQLGIDKVAKDRLSTI